MQVSQHWGALGPASAAGIGPCIHRHLLWAPLSCCHSQQSHAAGWVPFSGPQNQPLSHWCGESQAPSLTVFPQGIPVGPMETVHNFLRWSCPLDRPESQACLNKVINPQILFKAALRTSQMPPELSSPALVPALCRGCSRCWCGTQQSFSFFCRDQSYWGFLLSRCEEDGLCVASWSVLAQEGGLWLWAWCTINFPALVPLFGWKSLSKAAACDGAHEGVRPKSQQSVFQVCHRPGARTLLGTTIDPHWGESEVCLLWQALGSACIPCLQTQATLRAEAVILTAGLHRKGEIGFWGVMEVQKKGCCWLGSAMLRCFSWCFLDLLKPPLGNVSWPPGIHLWWWVFWKVEEIRGF